MSELLFREMACGGCGGAEHRIKAAFNDRSDNPIDVMVICVKCGNVSHLVVPTTRIAILWGRELEGEKADGQLCSMPWRPA